MAFEYFVTSGPLYNTLSDDIKSPIIRFDINSLKVRWFNFLGDIFSAIFEIEKMGIILVDVVYVKVSLQYLGNLFGMAEKSDG